MSITAMKDMANYIDALGGDSKKYRQAIEQAEKEEPVAQDVQEKCRIETVPAKGGLLPTPPAAQRQWVGLTDEEMYEIVRSDGAVMKADACYIVEKLQAKIKEKNT